MRDLDVAEASGLLSKEMEDRMIGIGYEYPSASRKAAIVSSASEGAHEPASLEAGGGGFEGGITLKTKRYLCSRAIPLISI